ncbi:hypothetical protein E4U54_007517 [Claviceps lovelessii]|nr:hypothetical protein E4U54_007517 [Claviceps lovelessii]
MKETRVPPRPENNVQGPKMKFLVFADDRGDDANNPHCFCAAPSKRQISSPGKGRKVHYVCGGGECDFYRPCYDENGKLVSVTSNLVDLLFRMKIA